jgi:23S rRNA (cytosine1962-C5)-methyltransferase
VLDVFAYQGAWGLAALMAGAREVLAVDGSAPALELASRAATANGLADRFSTRQGDAFDVLKELAGEGQRFDAVVVDPPAFARTRKDEKNARIAYERINKLAVRLLASGGILATSSCSYHVDLGTFLRCVARAIQSQGRTARLLDVRGQSIDHAPLMAMAEGSYLKCLLLELV